MKIHYIFLVKKLPLSSEDGLPSSGFCAWAPDNEDEPTEDSEHLRKKSKLS